MLILRIDLLTGRYVATSYTDRDQPEWPPHPARVFSALVATHHTAALPSADERRALEWLERQAPPAICASSTFETAARVTVPVFVPVNDVGVMPGFHEELASLREAIVAFDMLRQRQADATSVGLEAADRQLAKAEKVVTKEKARLETSIAKAVTPGTPNAAALAAAVAVLPERRVRQPRAFPSVTPLVPVIDLVWDAEPSPADRAALDALARRVTRIGHSSSLVACHLVNDAPAPEWVPADDGPRSLRVTSEGQLRRLEDEFARHREELPRALPCRLQGYSRRSEITQETARSVMGEDWIVFRRLSGPALPTRRAPDVASVLRDVLMKFAGVPWEILSGHEPDGKPSQRPHAVFVALPFVKGPRAEGGRTLADGTLLGAAIILPRGATRDERHHVLQAIGRWEAASGVESDDAPPTVRLFLGHHGELRLQRVEGAVSLRNLDPSTWSGSSRFWSTVTPLALDRNPGDLRARQAAEAAAAVGAAVATIGRGCVQIGLPAPAAVGISPISRFAGVESSVVYAPFPTKAGRLRRVLVHADLTFEIPVRGPVLLGAGRYSGLGLCLPREAE
jgi:CRISPR-associated protein Csb2